MNLVLICVQVQNVFSLAVYLHNVGEKKTPK